MATPQLFLVFQVISLESRTTFPYLRSIIRSSPSFFTTIKKTLLSPISKIKSRTEAWMERKGIRKDNTGRSAVDFSRVLPTELWIEVFSNLDYLTLYKFVAPVCKYFKEIIDEQPCPALDRILFRGGLHEAEPRSLPNPYNQSFVRRPPLQSFVHPLLRRLGFTLYREDAYYANAHQHAAPGQYDDGHVGIYFSLIKEFFHYSDISPFADKLDSLIRRALSWEPRFQRSGENILSAPWENGELGIDYMRHKITRAPVNGTTTGGRLSLGNFLVAANLSLHNAWGSILDTERVLSRSRVKAVLQSFERLKRRMPEQFDEDGDLAEGNRELIDLMAKLKQRIKQ